MTVMIIRTDTTHFFSSALCKVLEEEFSWNTSMAALATVSNHWFSSGELLLNCLNMSCRSSQDIRKVHISRFCNKWNEPIYHLKKHYKKPLRSWWSCFSDPAHLWQNWRLDNRSCVATFALANVTVRDPEGCRCDTILQDDKDTVQVPTAGNIFLGGRVRQMQIMKRYFQNFLCLTACWRLEENRIQLRCNVSHDKVVWVTDSSGNITLMWCGFSNTYTQSVAILK